MNSKNSAKNSAKISAKIVSRTHTQNSPRKKTLKGRKNLQYEEAGQALQAQKSFSEGFEAKTPEEKRLRKLILEIEKLESDLRSAEELIQKIQLKVQTDFYPLLKKFHGLGIQIFQYALEYLKTRKLKKSEKKIILGSIFELLEEFEHKIGVSLADEERSEFLENLRLELSNRKELAEQEEFQDMFAIMEGLFGGISEIGIPGDDQDETRADFFDDSELKKSGRSKKSKQSAQQLPLDLAAKSLYRDLVKAHHPDVHLDEQVKTEKHDIMQKITTAYRENDFMTLLKLKGGLAHLDAALIKHIEPLLKKNRDQIKQRFDELFMNHQEVLSSYLGLEPKKQEKKWKSELKVLELDIEKFSDMLAMMGGSDQGFMYWAKNF